MKIAESYEAFINDRQSYCAPDTIRYYRENLASFMKWLQSAGIDDTEQLDPEVLKDYVKYLREIRKIKNTSPAYASMSLPLCWNSQIHALTISSSQQTDCQYAQMETPASAPAPS